MNETLKNNLIVVKDYLFYLSKIKKYKNLDYLEIWIPILEKNYPNLWDIQISNDNYINIIIKYPEFEISNSIGLKHTIKDLYVNINHDLCTQQDGGFSFCMSGFRPLTNTKENYYTHSHLSDGSKHYDYFCLGSGTPLSLAFAGQLNAERLNADYMEMLFRCIDEYLKWESLEGGPYRKMQNFLSRENKILNVFNKDIVNDIFTYLINDLKTENSKLNIKRNLINGKVEIVDDQNLKTLIINRLTSLNSSQDILFTWVHYLGLIIENKFYSYNSLQRQNNNNKDSQTIVYNSEFYFLGEKIKKGIINTTDTKNLIDELNVEDLEICPALLQFLIYNLNTYINDKFNEYEKSQFFSEFPPS